ncbi:Transposase, ISXO2-like domain-containing protein [Strongyloides ratti]|uniref:Transposase, ISXO2-like domain-containing protein n=1 Tax=Strongyloides ratti TaxID=34506 RepID=A0A090LDB0_STRRB|nr:Transposase, ISXO2-like domain-containing protein [Strongyloides ratti]CEF67761.1 Transposase, ISXO2-like domain-containing protein [Strongyloides ratti]
MASIPVMASLSNIFFNEEAALRYLQDERIIKREMECPECGGATTFQRAKLLFKCTKKSCRKSVSAKNGTFFGGQRLPFGKILHMAYLWLCRTPVTSIKDQCGHSSATVCSFMGYFRQLVADALDTEDCVIGGEGIVVEIDETKMGKRKYHRGHPVDGVWVVGGVEKTEERRVFAVPVEKRDSETLLDVIKKHVKPGSIIHTDLWRGYEGIEEKLGFKHCTVNHSVSFKDPETGIHTNTIEGTWNGFKIMIPARSRTKKDMEERLWEFAWRRANKKKLWAGFLDALREVVYINK